MMGIRIGYDFAQGKLWLNLTSARQIDGWDISVKEAAFVALECIRRVTVRYGHKPTVIIRPPRGEDEQWKKVQKRFAEHDFSKPFKLS